MTRPNALLGVLAAVGVGTLLWLARLIVAADLTVGTSVAAWGLWLLVLLTATTVVAYVRELSRHRHAGGRVAGWRPLPGLVLLWVGGLTAVPVLALMLPADAAPRPSKATPTAGALSAQESTAPTRTPASRTTTARPTLRSTHTEASRSTHRTAAVPSASTSPRRTPQVATTTTHSRRVTTLPTPTSTTTTTPSTPTSTTPTPLIDITVLPNGRTKTTPPHR